MLFLSFFRTLQGKSIQVELKNGLVVQGTLASVDQYLNTKLVDVRIVESDKYPQLMAVKTLFIRGNVLRYIHVAPEYVDTELLQDASRRDALSSLSEAAADAASAAAAAAAPAASAPA